MPTYEYACRSCGHHLEVVQSFADDPLTSCPNCGGALRKVFGSIGIVLKGSGFYKTDSRSVPSDAKPAADGSAKSDAPPAKEAPATSTSSTGGGPKEGGSTSGSSSDSSSGAGSAASSAAAGG